MEIKLEGSKGTSVIVTENGKIIDVKLVDRKYENPLYRILGKASK